MNKDITENIRATIIVHGNVQKADYRGRVVSIAKKLNITGTVHNIVPDGTVKIIAEGEKQNIEQFCSDIDIKNSLIKVDKMERKDSSPTWEYENFYKCTGEGETDERLDTAAEYLKELINVTKNGFGDIGKKLENGFGDIGKKLEKRLSLEVFPFEEQLTSEDINRKPKPYMWHHVKVGVKEDKYNREIALDCMARIDFLDKDNKDVRSSVANRCCINY